MACQPQCNPGTGEEWKGSCEHDRPLVVTLQKERDSKMLLEQMIIWINIWVRQNFTNNSAPEYYFASLPVHMIEPR